MSNDSPRNPKAGISQEMVKSDTFGVYLVPAAEDAPDGVYPPVEHDSVAEVESQSQPEDVVARAESRPVAAPAQPEAKKSSGGRKKT